MMIGDPYILSEWHIWQLLDSAFPAGGLAHSGGVEAALQSGAIQSAQDLEIFLREHLQQLVHGAVPFVCAAGLQPIEQLDAMQETLLANHIANRASRLQGAAFLSAAESIFDIPSLAAIRAQIATGNLCGHYPVMFGAIMRSLHVEPSTAARMFLFVSLRSVVAAAVRLGVVGPLEAQRVQLRLADALEAAALESKSIAPEDARQTAPLLELWQMCQDRLYSRLFQS